MAVANWLKARLRPKPSHTHPKALRGWREAIRPPRIGAPTIPATETAWSRHGVAPGGSGVDQPKTMSSRENAMSNRHKAHSDQASQVVARRLIPPTPRSRSFVPVVTTPLYSTTVSRTLRLTLRG